MKLLALIFSFLTLTLSTVPCFDSLNEITDTFQTEENHSDHSEDGCTPFCACSCCGITIAFGILVFDYEIFNTYVNHAFKYKTNYKQDYITSIWHPPASS